MSEQFTGHALCQALMLEGVSSRTEAQIETTLRNLWESNGPDFVLDYLKVLKTDTEHSLLDPTYRYHHQNGEVSVAWNHKEGRPKGPLGAIYKQFGSPLERSRVLGAMIYSVTYEAASKKQIEKFTKAIQSKSKSDETIPVSDKFLQRLESSITAHVRKVEPFGMTDLTNTMLPYAHESFSTRKDKQIARAAMSEPSVKDGKIVQTRSLPAVHKAVGELYAHKLAQFYTAPSCCKKAWNAILEDVYKSKDSIPADVAYPRRVSPRPFEARDYEVNPDYGFLCMVTAEYSPRGKADYIGRLDFLQKPGGKLRSIANVNRYVNWTMVPFAKGLEDVIYHRPEVWVKDQKEGLRQVQQMLREGRKVVSLDLSSATDTLDFRVLMRAFQRDYPGMQSEVLRHYAEYFETLAELPLWCDPLDCAVQFSTGQPLGMKGSFQVLTAMNYFAGLLAERESGLSRKKGETPNFLVVGDDFVCDDRMAKAYVDVISSWGGVTNLEKSMRSDKYGEFLSHLVTENRVYQIKPKYKLGSKFIYSNPVTGKKENKFELIYSNLEKGKKKHASTSGLYRLSETEMNAIDIMSEYSVDEMDYRNCLPHFRSKDLSIDDYSLELMSTALSIVSDLRESTPPEMTISKAALEYIFLEDPTIIEKNSGYVPVIHDRDGTRFAQGNAIHDDIVTVPTSIQKYDHHTGEDVEVETRRRVKQAVESKAREMRKIDDAFNRADSNSQIDLGYGKAIDAQDLVVAAMQAIEEESRAIPNRHEAATSLKEKPKAVESVASSIDPPPDSKAIKSIYEAMDSRRSAAEKYAASMVRSKSRPLNKRKSQGRGLGDD